MPHLLDSFLIAQLGLLSLLVCHFKGEEFLVPALSIDYSSCPALEDRLNK